jgi:uncharacterized membrane protein
MQLVEETYKTILSFYSKNGLISGMTLLQNDVVIYYSATPKLFILKSGLLVMSSSLLDKCLEIGGVDLLGYLISHELSHLAQSHMLSNLSAMIAYGDLRK